MAGGSLVTKLQKGFGDFLAAGLVTGTTPRLYGAQAEGCAPIVHLFERGGTQIEPEVPNTIVRSLAIGNPADGPFAVRAMRDSGGWSVAVSDREVVDGIRLLAESTGVLAETAGGVTVAAAEVLARTGRLGPQDEVVLAITGHGLKTLDAISTTLAEAPVIAPRLREVAALVEHAA
jgi:threonine synthase